MASFKRLTVRPAQPHIFAPSCTFDVESGWLEQQRKRASNGPVSIVVGSAELAEWLSAANPGGIVNPYLSTHQKSFQMDLGLLLSQPQKYQLSIKVLGQLQEISGELTCLIEYGSVRLRLPNGFEPAFFSQNSIPGQGFAAWHLKLWNEPNFKVAGLAFGATDFELELLEPAAAGPKKRRRVNLSTELKGAPGQSHDLWQLTACSAGADFRSPDDVLQTYRQKVTDQLRALGGFAVRNAERRIRQAAGVFYERIDSKPKTIIRPDFAIEFSDGTVTRPWGPLTLRDTNSVIQLLDSDEIERMRSSQPANALPEARFVLTRKLVSGSTRTSVVEKHPELKCLGISSGRLQAGFLWQFGDIHPQPPSLSTTMPGWTRWQLPDSDLARTAQTDQAFPVTVSPTGSGWTFYLDLQASVADAAGQTTPDGPILPVSSGPMLSFSLGADSLRIELFSGTITACSANIEMFTGVLPVPSEPPNVRLLDGSLSTTRLVFSEPAPVEPRPAGREQSSVSLAQNSGSAIVGRLGAIVTFAPFVREAAIDFVSAGAHNLRQSFDSASHRPVVERDTTHTLTPFEITNCGVGADGGLTDARYDAKSASLAALSALAPSVAIYDDVSRPDRVRQLTYRNLALEQAEFAVASQDRSLDGEPQAIAQNKADFVGAVRDAFVVAVPDLKDSAAGAGEVRQWLPGATLDNVPSSWIEYSPLTEDLTKRAPIIHLDGFNQQLTLGGRSQPEQQFQDWLTCDVRLQAVDLDAANRALRPRLAVQPATTMTGGSATSPAGSLRARNGHVPLVFDGANLARCSANANRVDQQSTLDWLAVAQESGEIFIVERATGQRLATLPEAGAGNGAPRAVGVGQLADLKWVIAVFGPGRVLAWVWVNNQWQAPIQLRAAGVTVDVAAIAASGATVAIVLGQSGAPCKLLIGTVTDATSLPIVSPAIPGAAVASRIDVLVQDTVVFLAAAKDDVPTVWKGELSAGTWSFATVDSHLPADTRADGLSLNMLGPVPWLAILDATAKKCKLARLDTGVDLKHEVVWTSPVDPVDVALVRRPAGLHGLLPDSLPGFLCVTDKTGGVDVWLISRQNRLLCRLNAHDGPLTGIEPCVVGLPVHIGDNQVPTYRRDARAGLATCGQDGFARLWDLDAGKMIAEFHSANWMLDNLGTLRGCTVSPEPGDVQVQRVTRPNDVAAQRSEPGSACAADGICISRARDSQPAALILGGVTLDAKTEIQFSCDQLQLRKVNGSWRPERVAETSSQAVATDPIPEFLTSRGSFGVFGFSSNFNPGSTDERTSTAATAYLPRVAGLPMFVTEIRSIELEDTQDPPQSYTVDDLTRPCNLAALTLRAALINPLYFDGAKLDFADCAQGILPVPIARAIAEESFVTVTVKRVDGRLEVVDVASESPLHWNVLAGDDDGASSTRSGFAGVLESLTFNVTFDRAAHRVVLTLHGKECYARLLGGRQTLSLPADSAICAVGFGRRTDGTPCYGFTTPWQAIKTASPCLPIPITSPLFDFSEFDAKSVRLLTHGFDAGLPEVLSLHAVQGKEKSETKVGLWSAETGVGEATGKLEQYVQSLPTPVTQAAIGRLPVPTVIIPSVTGLAASELPIPAGGARIRDLIQQGEIQSTCFVAARGRNWLVTGGATGEIHIWDEATGRLSRNILVGTGSIRALAGCEHAGNGYVLAAVDSSVSLINLQSDKIGSWSLASRITSCDLLSVDGKLYLAAASDEPSGVAGWFWTDDKTPTPLGTAAIDSVSIGRAGDEVAVYLTSELKLQWASLDGTKHDMTPPVAVIAGAKSGFVATSNLEHWLALAEPAKPLRRLHRAFSAGAWQTWDIAEVAPTPLPSSVQLKAIRVPVAVNEQTSTFDAYAIVAPRNFSMTSTVQVWNLTKSEQSAAQLAAGIANDPLPLAVAMIDKPHGVLISGTLVSVVDLASGDLRQSWTVAAPVQQVEFTTSDSGTWIVSRYDTSVVSINVTTWERATFDAALPIHSLTVHQGLALVTLGDNPGAKLWRIGRGESDAAQRCDLLADKKLIQGFLTTDPEAPAGLLDLLLLEEEHIQTCYRLTLDRAFVITQTVTVAFEAPVEIRDSCVVDGRLHVLARNTTGSKTLRQFQLWILPAASGAATPRWTVAGSADGTTAFATHQGSRVRILALSPESLFCVPLEGWLRLDETGISRAQHTLDLTLDSDSLGFELRARLLQDGTVGLSKVTQSGDEKRTSLIVARHQRHGLYASLFDLRSTDGFSGAGSLVLSRGLDGKLAGTVVRGLRCHFKSVIIVRDAGGRATRLSATVTLVSQEQRKFGTPAERQLLVSGSGSITIDELPGVPVIYFVDQVIIDSRPGRKCVMTGFLLSRSKSGVQGPVRVQCLPGGGIADVTFELLPGAYRAVAVKVPQIDPASTSRAVFVPASPNDVALDMSLVERVAGIPARFTLLLGTDKGLRFRTLSDDRLPVDLCLDDDISNAFPILDSTQSQTIPLTGFGSRLRLTRFEDELMSGGPPGAELPENKDAAWLLQPLLMRVDRPRLLDVGIMFVNETAAEMAVVENIMAVLRPGSEQQSSTTNLITASGIGNISEVILHDQWNGLPADHRILLRMRSTVGGAPEFSIVVPETNEPDAAQDAQTEPILQTVRTGLMATRLTHCEATRWIRDSAADRQILPDRRDALRDHDRFVWREFLLGRQFRTAIPIRQAVFDTSYVLAKESTAFSALPKLWHVPDEADLKPWLADQLAALPAVPAPENVVAPSTALQPFQPDMLRVRASPDKPGAMVHHQYQWVTAPGAGQGSRRAVRTGQLVQFAEREPMQLNPPRGASLELIPTGCKGVPHSKRKQISNIAFAWKETLGTLPVRVSGDEVIRIQQISSQTTGGVPPQDVKLELLPESLNCLQMFVQINDQVLEIDQRNPYFPVYIQPRKQGEPASQGRVPPNVYLVTTLNKLDPSPAVELTVKLDTGATVHVTTALSPRLVVEQQAGSNDVQMNAAFVRINDGNKPALFALNSNSDPLPANTPAASLNWKLAKTVWIEWHGDFEVPVLGVPQKFQVAVIHGGANGKKRVQPLPYSATAPKCAAILTVDEQAGGRIHSIQQRTLLFGDSASIASGRGVLRQISADEHEFAFETTDHEQLDCALPALTADSVLGLILVKYFIDGQTLSDATKIELG